MAFPLGAALTAGASLIGGWLGKSSSDAARDDAAAARVQDYEWQKEFAKNGIRWRVEDAKAAGLHPAFGLGNPTTFSPASYVGGGDNSFGAGIAQAGQDIGRAIDAGRTHSERAEARKLSLENMGLQNDLLRAQIAKVSQAGSPPGRPGANQGYVIDGQGSTVLPVGKFGSATPLVVGGERVAIDRRWSDGEKFEDRWGDWGGSLAGMGVMAADLVSHAKRRTRVKKVPFSWVPKLSYERR